VKTDALKARFEDALAMWLEDAVTSALRHALPGASVWNSVQWHDSATGKDFENDTVIVLDDWLIVVESKSGQVTDSARRGSYDRLKREVRRLMVEPPNSPAGLSAICWRNRGSTTSNAQTVEPARLIAAPSGARSASISSPKTLVT
jgi:hypothetical protein